MKYKSRYASPIGDLILKADEEGLTDVYFETADIKAAGGMLPADDEEGLTDIYYETAGLKEAEGMLPADDEEGPTDVYYETVDLKAAGRRLPADDEEGPTDMYFETAGLKAAEGTLSADGKETAPGDSLFIDQAKEWLDLYFAGSKPDFFVKMHTTGTVFQEEVWQILREIPYGETVTYGEIAKQIADDRGIPKMAAQAVGGAVGRNRIAILIPCHRVIGADGKLTGYAGGTERKAALLEIERCTAGVK